MSSSDARSLRTPAAAWLALAVALMSADLISIVTSAEVSRELEVVVERDRSSARTSAETKLALDVTVGAWTSSLRSTFEAGAWDEQRFEVAWETQATEVASRVRFEPAKDRFKDWRIEVARTIGEAELEAEYRITRTRGWLVLDAAWAGERAEIDARLRHRSTGAGTPLRFYDARLEADLDLVGIDLSISVAIDDDGFGEATLELANVSPGRVPWLSFDLDVAWALADTTAEITSEIRAGETGLVELEFEAGSGGGLVDSLRLTELGADGRIGRIDADGRILLDPEDWIDEAYAATVEFAARIGPGRGGALGLKLLWRGDAGNGLLPARAIPRLSAEFAGKRSVEIEVDLLLKPFALLGFALELSW